MRYLHSFRSPAFLFFFFFRHTHRCERYAAVSVGTVTSGTIDTSINTRCEKQLDTQVQVLQTYLNADRYLDTLSFIHLQGDSGSGAVSSSAKFLFILTSRHIFADSSDKANMILLGIFCSMAMVALSHHLVRSIYRRLRSSV